MAASNGWFEKLLRRLPLTEPGTLVALEEGVGVFLGNWVGGDRVYGVQRGGRVYAELYPAGEKDWKR
jgi:hypothetical protein